MMVMTRCRTFSARGGRETSDLCMHMVAPVGPLGADLRVAPCVDTGTLKDKEKIINC